MLPGAVCDTNYNRPASRSGLDALLHHVKLNVHNPPQLLGAERLENDDLVQAVHELGRELSTRRLYADTRHLCVAFLIETSVVRRGIVEAQPRTAQGTHFAGAEIAGQDNHRRRKIDLAVVAQR